MVIWTEHFFKFFSDVSFVICFLAFHPNALRKAKIVYNFGLSEYNRVHAKSSHGISAIGEGYYS